MQQPDFFARYAAVMFETAESRRGLGTAIMKYATKILQQRAVFMPDKDTGNGDAATATALEQQNHGTDKGDARPDGQKERPPRPPQDGPPGMSGQPNRSSAAPTKQAPAAEAAPTQEASKPAQDGQAPGTKQQRSRSSAAPESGAKRPRASGGATRGEGEEGEVGAASKKPAFREGFSHKRVTELLADKVSILNDPFEAFIWTICVQLDTKYFLAVVEAEDDGSEATTWLKVKAKMDLEYCDTQRLANLCAGSKKAGRPEEQVWGPSAVTFANWLANHEKPKVCDIIFLHLPVELSVSSYLSFILSVCCSFSCFPLNSLVFHFCLYLYLSFSLSLFLPFLSSLSFSFSFSLALPLCWMLLLSVEFSFS